MLNNFMEGIGAMEEGNILEKPPLTDI